MPQFANQTAHYFYSSTIAAIVDGDYGVTLHKNTLVAALILFGATALPLLPAEAQAKSYPMLLQTYSVVPGYSETALYRWKRSFMPNVTGIEVKATDTAENGCRAEIHHIQIEYAEAAPREKFVPDLDGKVTLPKPGMLGVLVAFDLRLSSAVVCQLSIGLIAQETHEQPPEPPAHSGVGIPSDEFDLAGSVRYGGGFAGNLEINVGSEIPLTHVWARVPHTCRDVQIEEIYYGFDGAWYHSSPVPGQRGVFLLGNEGRSADSVRILANGPIGIDCDIPIFTRRLGG